MAAFSKQLHFEAEDKLTIKVGGQVMLELTSSGQVTLSGKAVTLDGSQITTKGSSVAKSGP